MKLEEKVTKLEGPSLVSFRKKAPKIQQKVVLEKVELSKNIQKFDEKRTKVFTDNPYSYNQVSKKIVENTIKYTPTSEQMITDPMYNTVAKLLGVDTKKEWGIYSDKVYAIVEWAKNKLKTNEIDVIYKFISKKGKEVPSMGAKRIDDIYIFSKLNK